MTPIINKRTYILLLWLCFGVATTPLQAQIYSTANYRGISNHRNTPAYEAPCYSNTPSFGTTSSMRLHTTSSKFYHTYGTSDRHNSVSSNAYRNFIRTKATSIQGGIIAEKVGYIATTPRRTVTYPTGITPPLREEGNGENVVEGEKTYDDESSQETPTNAPLGFGWDALILLLFLAGGYALHLRRKLRTAPL